jgi:hypothetical protein
MRFKPADSIVAVGFLMLAAGLSIAAIVEPVAKNTTVALRRGSTNITSAVLAEACVKVKCSLPSLALTVENCPDLRSMLISADGLTRTIGSNVYQCIVADQRMVTFKAASIVLPPVDCVVSEWGPPSDPVWLGCTGAQQTRAVIRIRSIVTQPANGGAACPALIDTTTQTRTCAALSWTPPTRNTDGTTITSLTGYRIVYGRSPSELTQSVQIPPASSYVIPGIASGAWYFAVMTLAGGNQSAQSGVVTRVIP